MAREKVAKEDYATQVAKRVIEQLRAGTAPWQKPWVPGEQRLPYNPTTGKAYKGMNSVWLAMMGHSDPRWLTYKQAAAVGAQIRKGEKGTVVQYWMFQGEETKRDAAGKPVIGPDGNPVKEVVEYERPRVMSAVVFNAEQMDGLAPLQARPVSPDHERHARAEALMQGWVTPIRHVEGDRAYYSPSRDEIVVPDRGQFHDADGYYATSFHEMGHSTGHSSRLDRDLSGPFGSELYAREELVAELVSLMVGDAFEMGHNPDRHASYVASWIKALEEDPREIFRAAKAAEQALGFMLAREKELVAQVEAAPIAELTPAERADLQAELNALQNASELSDEQAKNLAHVRDQLDGKGAATETLRELLDESDEIKGPVRQENDPAFAQEVAEVYRSAHFADWFYDYSDDRDVRARGAVGVKAAMNGLADLAEKSGEHQAIASAIWDKAGPGTGVVPAWYVAEEQRTNASQAAAAVEIADRLMRQPAPALKVDKPQQSNDGKAPMKSEQRVMLDVPYAEKDAAKQLGARWDKEAKKWYAPPGLDLNPLEKWFAQEKSPEAAQDTASVDFAKFMEENGLVLPAGFEPRDDGTIHRLPVKGDDRGQTGGAYSFFKDRNGGLVWNFREGVERAEWWSDKAVEKLTPEQAAAKAKRDAEAAAARDAAQQAKWDLAASIIGDKMAQLEPAPADHRYLTDKGVAPVGVFVWSGPSLELGGEEGENGLKPQVWGKAGDLVVPVADIDGNLQGAQTISPRGFKMFPRGGKVAGGMHVLGDLGGDGPIGIAEGYATSATVHDKTGLPIAAAFHSGNLKAVAEAIRERYPDRQLIVFTDNDHKREGEIDEKTGLVKINVGRVKGIAAAEAVGGHAIVPQFPPGADGTDWNDVLKHYGEEELRRQLEVGLSTVQRHELTESLLAGSAILETKREREPGQEQTLSRGIDRAERELEGGLSR